MACGSRDFYRAQVTAKAELRRGTKKAAETAVALAVVPSRPGSLICHSTDHNRQ